MKIMNYLQISNNKIRWNYRGWRNKYESRTYW
jgi:hypothetical protein